MEISIENNNKTSGKESYIYVLRDPSNVSKTMYVGWTEDMTKRYLDHLSEARRGNKRYVYSWIRSLTSRGVKPEMFLEKKLPPFAIWQAEEQATIAHYKAQGIKLCNLTDGGEGCPGYKHTEDSLKRMSQCKTGKPLSDEHKQAMMRKGLPIEEIAELYKSGESMLQLERIFGINHNTIRYHLEHSGVELREERFTEAAKQRISESLTGRKLTEEHKQNISNGQLGRVQTEETRSKISAGHKGKVLTEGHRQKLSDAKKGKITRCDVKTEDLIELYNKGLSLRAIGKQFSMEHHAVKARLKDAGVYDKDTGLKRQLQALIDRENSKYIR